MATYEGDGRTVFAYKGSPQIAPREKHNARGDLPMPGQEVTEDQLVEIESYLASGLFIGRNEALAMQLAAACRLTAAKIGNLGRNQRLDFTRRLTAVAEKLERLARS